MYRRFRNNKKDPSFKVPVIFHTLRDYDGHMLVAALGKYKNKQIHGIASNSERYITFSLSRLHFIDSFQFLGSSLEKLGGKS